jgi:hypothetical protein
MNKVQSFPFDNFILDVQINPETDYCLFLMEDIAIIASLSVGLFARWDVQSVGLFRNVPSRF